LSWTASAASPVIEEISERAVIAFFSGGGKETGRKFVVFPVVVEAFTAQAFARTGFVGAIANLQVLLFMAIHVFPPDIKL